MTATMIKICSLQAPEHAEWVIEAGADMFGLIFAQARRQISVVAARAIVARSREVATEPPKAVGVFVEQTVDEINAVADEVGLDYVQVNKPERITGAVALNRPALVVIHTSPGLIRASVVQTISRVQETGTEIAGLIVDGFRSDSYGGTGTVADWNLARELAVAHPVMLAGGLHPANVSEAIDLVQPVGVDVSSGVETDGVKDRDKILAFVAAARASLLRRVDVLPIG